MIRQASTFTMSPICLDNIKRSNNYFTHEREMSDYKKVTEYKKQQQLKFSQLNKRKH